ncbi:MAG: metal-dependent hydrolase [Victivallaceae bacterium]|nr:metal-dependent hydrolase [Victivallaceae bacterium]
MHTSTHVLSGWCVGNIFNLTGRERLFCMIAATAQDLDGLGIVFGQKYYWDWHHVLFHNLLSAIVLTGILVIWSKHHIKAALLYFSLFHLHLLMDYVGSGELWTIHYLYPFNKLELMWQHAWPMFPWQNITAGFILIGWTILIAAQKARTPLELVMPSLDRQLAAKARNMLSSLSKEKITNF